MNLSWSLPLVLCYLLTDQLSILIRKVDMRDVGTCRLDHFMGDLHALPEVCPGRNTNKLLEL